MKNTLITLASVATLAVSANAQVAINPQSLGLAAGASADGTYDIASLTGISGLTVTISGGDVNSAGNNFLISNADPITFGFNQLVDATAFHGSTLVAATIDGITAQGLISFTGDTVVNDVQLSSPNSFTSLVFNNSGATLNGSDGLSLTWDIANTTSIQGFTTNTGTSNVFGISVLSSVVPEPSSTALLGLGALGLLARRKR